MEYYHTSLLWVEGSFILHITWQLKYLLVKIIDEPFRVISMNVFYLFCKFLKKKKNIFFSRFIMIYEYCDLDWWNTYVMAIKNYSNTRERCMLYFIDYILWFSKTRYNHFKLPCDILWRIPYIFHSFNL